LFQAQSLVRVQFPNKIVELDNLLKSELFTMTDMSPLHALVDDPSSLWNGQADDLKVGV
jgi:hypothetical protein